MTAIGSQSDTRYRYLSRFSQWVSSSLFYPVKDVGVKVIIKYATSKLSLENCKVCDKMLKESKIMDIVMSVSCKDIEDFH